MYYNARFIVYGSGVRLGRARLNALVSQSATLSQWARVSTVNGKPCLRVEVRSAADIRAAVRGIRFVLDTLGYTSYDYLTQASRRAMSSRYDRS
jgi:hypothetical protein